MKYTLEVNDGESFHKNKIEFMENNIESYALFQER